VIVEIRKMAWAGEVQILPGKYMVSMNRTAKEIRLSGKGADIILRAIKKPGRRPARKTEVSLIPSGGAFATLIVTVPPGEQFSVLLKYSHLQSG